MYTLPPPISAVALDLDGTLVDSAPDLAAAGNVLLERLGAPPLPVATIAGMIGDGIDTLVHRVLTAAFGDGADTLDLDACRRTYGAIYRERVWVDSRVYDGVQEGLAQLTAAGATLLCVTNKRSAMTLPLLAQSGLAPWFRFVLCADRREWRKPAPAMLEEACRRLGIAPSALVMVGDSLHDVNAARAAGCACVLVRYGYGRGLEGAPDATASIDRLSELSLAPARE